MSWKNMSHIQGDSKTQMSKAAVARASVRTVLGQWRDFQYGFHVRQQAIKANMIHKKLFLTKSIYIQGLCIIYLQ